MFGSKPMLLPTDAQERKQIPITTGVLDYFPLAIAEVAKCSWAGNQQHHPDKELHWDKTKSTDHGDCIARHLVDRGKFDTDGQRHSAKLAWRSLALLQLELESEKEKIMNEHEDQGYGKMTNAEVYAALALVLMKLEAIEHTLDRIYNVEGQLLEVREAI